MVGKDGLDSDTAKTNTGVRNTGTMIVLVHLIVLLSHASGHLHLAIGANSWQSAFIAIVIFAAPLFAMILLWTRAQRMGVALLGFAMAGAFLFGFYYHFVVPGADNALGLAPGAWSTVFLITSVLLAAIEALGCAWCLRALR